MQTESLLIRKLRGAPSKPTITCLFWPQWKRAVKTQLWRIITFSVAMANGLANSLRFTHPEYTEQYHHSFGDVFVMNPSPISPFSSLLSHTHSWGTDLVFLAAKCSFISTSKLQIVTGYSLVLCCSISAKTAETKSTRVVKVIPNSKVVGGKTKTMSWTTAFRKSSVGSQRRPPLFKLHSRLICFYIH